MMLARLRQLLYLNPFHTPQSVLCSNNAESTVILGGGIIGLSTAYYLALAEHERTSDATTERNCIFVVDPSSKFCAGASEQNEGALGDFGFEEEVMPLAQLSYKLYARLADEINGKEKYGFGGFKIHAVFSNGYDPSNPRLPYPVKEQEDLSKLPAWLKVPSTWQAGLVSDSTHAKRLNPPKFCQFLQSECRRLGVHFLTSSVTVRIHTDEHQTKLTSVDIKKQETSDLLRLPCRNLVISAGSWSDKVFSELFPHSRCHIPMAQKQPAQNWLRIRNPKWKSKDDDRDCNQVFLAPALADEDIHFSIFLGGDIYVAGGFEDPDPPPPLPESVEMTPSELEAMKKTAAAYLNLEPRESVELIACGRAYLPRTTNNLPIITKMTWCDLFPTSLEQRDCPIGSRTGKGGVFLNLGHYLDGFTLGLGSGKVMSELITGAKTSVDLSVDAGYTGLDHVCG